MLKSSIINDFQDVQERFWKIDFELVELRNKVKELEKEVKALREETREAE